MKTSKKKDLMHQIVFVAPSIFVFMMIMGIPFILALYYSMTDWNGISANIAWVGLDNYKTIFTKDPSFATSFLFTTKFTVAVVVLTNVIGFLFAYALIQNLRTRNFLRTVFFIPNVLGGVILGFIWRFIFIRGFSAVGQLTGIPFFELSWLSDSATSFWALVIVSVWKDAGYVMIVYIAALTAVPMELKECAQLDGASSWQIIRSVILPYIAPTITVCMFYTISHAYKMYDLNYSLTNGGPYRSSESVAMNIVTEAFTNNRYGLGSAKAIILFVVIVIITGIQSFLSRKGDE